MLNPSLPQNYYNCCRVFLLLVIQFKVGNISGYMLHTEGYKKKYIYSFKNSVFLSASMLLLILKSFQCCFRQSKSIRTCATLKVLQPLCALFFTCSQMWYKYVLHIKTQEEYQLQETLFFYPLPRSDFALGSHGLKAALCLLLCRRCLLS